MKFMNLQFTFQSFLAVLKSVMALVNSAKKGSITLTEKLNLCNNT